MLGDSQGVLPEVLLLARANERRLTGFEQLAGAIIKVKKSIDCSGLIAFFTFLCRGICATSAQKQEQVPSDTAVFY